MEGVEIDQRLEAEDRVVADAEVVDVVARLFEVGGERRPIEDGHAADVHEVVLALDLMLVRDDRLAGRRIDGRRAGERIDERLLQVFERDSSAVEGVAGFFEAAGGDQAVLGDEPRA